jgi:mRNA-degrading endonuclease YafQ of YafQ-DinJ toxin-antitoxin module
MTFALVTTRHFERRARKFLRKHPDLRPVLRDTLDQLSEDPFEPRFKLHALSGSLSGIQAVSLTHSFRLTLILKVTEEEILLLDIGTHDEVYR